LALACGWALCLHATRECTALRPLTLLTTFSVKLRMESGEGMAISEFSYPLFQAYDWWSMYKNQGVQLQIGGSDQYGNICAGMDAVSHMRKIHAMDDEAGGEEDPRVSTYGLTTPLLTTALGEKFGKSAGNAVWLDRQMLNSFDLYQVCPYHPLGPRLLTHNSTSYGQPTTTSSAT
jgi:tyrosyl-tRNA synthetase